MKLLGLLEKRQCILSSCLLIAFLGSLFASSCEGQIFSGEIQHAEAIDLCNATPLYHCYNSSNVCPGGCDEITAPIKRPEQGATCSTGCGSGGSTGSSASGSITTTVSQGDHAPDELGRESYSGAAAIFNRGANLMHWADDILAGESGATLRRIHRPRHLAIPSSLGPGVFTNLDFSIVAESYGSSGVEYLQFLVHDPTAAIPYRLTSGADLGSGTQVSQVGPQTLLPDLDGVARHLTLGTQDAVNYGVAPRDYEADVTTSNFYLAFNGFHTATLVGYDGTVMEFDMLRVPDRETWDVLFGYSASNPAPAGFEYPAYTEARHGVYGEFTEKIVGRLRRIESNKVSYAITYKQWTVQEIFESFDRLMEIDQVSSGGETLSFQYQNGLISSISASDGQSATYTRASGGFPTRVDYADGSFASFARSQVAGTSLIEVDYDDPRANPEHRKKSVVYSGMVAGAAYHYNGAINQVRMISNGEQEVVYANFGLHTNHSNGLHDYLMYLGGGRLQLHANEAWPRQERVIYEFNDGWELNLGSTLSVSQNFTERYRFNYSDADKALSGNPTYVKTPTMSYRYGRQGPVAFKRFGSGANESFTASYSPVPGQVQRERDQQGKVTLYEYNDNGLMTSKTVGLKDSDANFNRSSYQYDPNPSDDVATDELAVYQWQYNAEGLLSKHIDPHGHETNYTYDSLKRIATISSPPETIGGQPPVTTYTYHNSGSGEGQLDTVVDPTGATTIYSYDQQRRLNEIQYGDGTSQRLFYVAAGNGKGMVEKRVNRLGVVTHYQYDAANRVIQRTVAAAEMDASGNETPTPDLATAETFTYLDGTQLPLRQRQAGALITHQYDQSLQRTQTVRNVAFGKQQTSKNAYSGGRLFLTINSDAGVTYYAYDENGLLTRSVSVSTNLILESDPLMGPGVSYTDSQGREFVLIDEGWGEIYYQFVDPLTGDAWWFAPGYALNWGTFEQINDPDWGPFASDTVEIILPDSSAVKNLQRDSFPAGEVAITDFAYDLSGNQISVIDPLGIETRYEYDSLGRRTATTSAFGTPSQARTETDYDLVGNVTEVRSPRYFDAADSLGHNQARENWTYTPAGNVATHVVAPGTSGAATETFGYDLAGRRVQLTDFAGNDSLVHHNDCCGKVTASENGLGHGTITRRNALGQIVHQISVEDYAAHSASLDDPVDAKTLREVTTRYDGRGRPILRTTWLVPRGAINVDDPPIAGLDGVPIDDGLTEQFLYDDNLSDGLGLDSSDGVAMLVSNHYPDAIPRLPDFDLPSLPPQWALAAAAAVSPTRQALLWQLTVSPQIDLLGVSGLLDSPLWDFLLMMQVNGGSSISLQDARNKLDDSIAQGGAGVSFDANAPGSARVSINAEGNVRFVISDAAGRSVMSGVLDPDDNSLVTWNCTVYDETQIIDGKTYIATSHVNALGNATTTLTDGAGRTIQSIDALGVATNYTYDAAGNQLSVRDPNGVGQDCVYDELGRDISCTDTVGVTTSMTYDKSGNKLTSTDGKGSTTSYTYDARGRQIKQTDRLGGETQFAYDAMGRLLSLTDAEGQVTSYTYDAAGSKLTETYPDHVGGVPGDATYGIVLFGYDGLGRAISKLDQAAITTSFDYDLAGRLIGRDLSSSGNGDEHSFEYDRANRMTLAKISRSGSMLNEVTFEYDDAGRKVSESSSLSSFPNALTTTTTYDLAGQVTGYTYPDGTSVLRTYSERGQLETIARDNVVINSRSYDDGGRLETSDYNNGVDESRTYSADNTLSGIAFSGADVGDLSYTWDSNKNKISEAIASATPMSNFGFASTNYDAEDRLVGWNRADGNRDMAWNLSQVGDWNSVTIDGSTQNRTHGDGHEVKTIGSAQVQHDSQGNMQSYSVPGTNIWAYLYWSADGKLVGAQVPQDVVAFQYDALGRRVSMSSMNGVARVFAYNGQQVVAEYDSGLNRDHNYFYASYIDEPVMRDGTGGLRYYHRNQQYSIIALTDGGGPTNIPGNITERYAYDAYGKPTFMQPDGTEISGSADGNRILYTGREYEESIGLYCFRERWYSPVLGRFLSRDPIGYVDGESLYRAYFAPNDLDPSGLSRHHWFPQALLSQVSGKCSGELAALGISGRQFIDFFTTELGPWRGGELHVEVQNRDPRGTWNNHVRGIFNNSKNCCDAIRQVRDSIPDWLQAAQDRLNLPSTGGMPEIMPWHGSQSHNVFFDYVIERMCDEPPPCGELVTNPNPFPFPVVPRNLPDWFDIPDWLKGIPPKIRGVFPLPLPIIFIPEKSPYPNAT